MGDKYYAIDENTILKVLETNAKTGLNDLSIDKHRKVYGLNVLPKKKEDSILTIFFRQLCDPIVLILVVTVFFSFLIQEFIDGLAIVFIIMVDLIMGTVEEWRANKTAKSLQDLIKYKVKVIRNSQEEIIDSNDLVVGDIVLLSSGDKISADMRILESNNLQVDESTLTGESVNVYKCHNVLSENTSLADRKNMVYAGCSVVTGRGRCVVCQTGVYTEIGKIAHEVTNLKEEKSPLTIRMSKLSKQISILIVIVALIIAIVLYCKNVSLNEIFLSVIALSVSAMPEGLPLALTMALSITSTKMAKKNVVCKRLNSVESLGSCTVIATDKTGTLTVNEQTAKKITFPSGEELTVEGVGYNFQGSFSKTSSTRELHELLTVSLLNNEASIEKINGNYNYYGDSIDIAFLVLGKKANIDISEYEVLERIPYESENKYSAVFYKYHNKVYCTVKGSLEVVMNFCDTMNVLHEKDLINPSSLKKQNELLASDGYRVIALASGEVKGFQHKDFYDSKDILKLNFLGMVSFIDPIREDVKSSIEECEMAGIKVLMITGDHPLTALSIAKELNIAKDASMVATGDELNNLYEEDLNNFDDFVASKRVFARVSPLDKLHIVESLKRQGEFVAVTGDGVNDAPAIRSASIGIAMGSGTSVAKETANMIIIDDNFKSIVSGVELGRTAYSNIRKVVYFLISCGLAEVLFFVLSLIFNMPMPLVAIQLLWLNVVTDGFQDLALSFEKSEADIMKNKPISPKETIFNRHMIAEVLVSGISIGLVVFLVWMFLIKKVGMDVSKARGYIMVLMVFIQNIHVFNCRSEKCSSFNVPILSNPFILFSIALAIGLQFIIMEVPFLSSLLQTKTVPISHMIYLFAFALIIFIVMEVYKLVVYRSKK